MSCPQEGVRKTGYTDFSLLSLSCSDYLALPAVGIELRNRLKGERISLQLPSQRVDRFDENIANIMGGSRASPSITFAPEAGTQAREHFLCRSRFGVMGELWIASRDSSGGAVRSIRNLMCMGLSADVRCRAEDEGHHQQGPHERGAAPRGRDCLR